MKPIDCSSTFISLVIRSMNLTKSERKVKPNVHEKSLVNTISASFLSQRFAKVKDKVKSSSDV